MNGLTVQVHDMFKRRWPKEYDIVHPRRYVPPPGYPNPKYVAVQMLTSFGVPDAAEIDVPEPKARVITWELVKHGVPTYFVGRELAQALTQTNPPQDMLLAVNRWIGLRGIGAAIVNSLQVDNMTIVRASLRVGAA